MDLRSKSWRWRTKKRRLTSSPLVFGNNLMLTKIKCPISHHIFPSTASSARKDLAWNCVKLPVTKHQNWRLNKYVNILFSKIVLLVALVLFCSVSFVLFAVNYFSECLFCFLIKGTPPGLSENFLRDMELQKTNGTLDFGSFFFWNW